MTSECNQNSVTNFMIILLKFTLIYHPVVLISQNPRKLIDMLLNLKQRTLIVEKAALYRVLLAVLSSSCSLFMWIWGELSFSSVTVILQRAWTVFGDVPLSYASTTNWNSRSFSKSIVFLIFIAPEVSFMPKE
jgi:hypothetical protein